MEGSDLGEAEFEKQLNANPASRAAFDHDMAEVLSDAGYRPPPHSVAPPAGLPAVRDSLRIQSTVRDRLRERPAGLLAELERLDPSQLSLDPFLGDEPDLLPAVDHAGVRTVLDAEDYVAAVQAVAAACRALVATSEKDFGDAAVDEADAARAATERERRLRENAVHLRQELSKLAEDDAGPLANRYRIELADAEFQMNAAHQMAHLDAGILATTDFAGWIARAVDQVRARYTAGIVTRRRRRTRIRRAWTAASVVGFAALALIVEELLTKDWSFLSLVVLAGVMLLVDRGVSRRQHRRSRQAQLDSLITAIRESGAVVDEIAERLDQVNGLRWARGLEPIEVTPLLKERKLLS
jgi:hypothetical protein